MLAAGEARRMRARPNACPCRNCAPAAPAASEGKAVAVHSLTGGAKRITYKIGPFDIRPGRNPIEFAPIVQRPQVDGCITPNLTRLSDALSG
jgi:hypothetical protein